MLSLSKYVRNKLWTPTARGSLKIVENDDGYNVVQNKTNIVLTKELKGFTSKFLSELGEVDGFILKASHLLVV